MCQPEVANEHRASSCLVKCRAVSTARIVTTQGLHGDGDSAQDSPGCWAAIGNAFLAALASHHVCSSQARRDAGGPRAISRECWTTKMPTGPPDFCTATMRSFLTRTISRGTLSTPGWCRLSSFRHGAVQASAVGLTRRVDSFARSSPLADAVCRSSSTTRSVQKLRLPFLSVSKTTLVYLCISIRYLQKHDRRRICTATNNKNTGTQL